MSAAKAPSPHPDAPRVRPAADWRFPARSEVRLRNGIRVLAYDCPGQHVVAASVSYDVPLAVEPRPLEGVAGLTGRCLARGAGGRNAEEFADALALCGSDLEAAASPDAFTVRLSAPSPHLARALALLADTARAPDFLEAEFAHEKRLRLQEIEQARAYPQHVAVEQLNAALFGAHRVARPTGGGRDSVERVSRNDMVSFARRELTPARATVVIAGDFSAIDPVDAIEREFGDWAMPEAEAATVDPPAVSAQPALVLVDFPDAAQATIRVGTPSITRADPRWPALFVANYAVGGNFSSRVNTVLREQKGVTYGANSSLDSSRGAGVLAVATSVRNDAAAESVGDIVSILGGAAGSLTDEEIGVAVRAASDGAALGFERADAVVARVEMLLSQGLPLDHVDANLRRIREVTTAEANAAYGEVIDAGALTIVVAGDAAALRGPLEELDYAPVTTVEAP